MRGCDLRGQRRKAVGSRKEFTESGLTPQMGDTVLPKDRTRIKRSRRETSED